MNTSTQDFLSPYFPADTLRLMGPDNTLRNLFSDVAVDSTQTEERLIDVFVYADGAIVTGRMKKGNLKMKKYTLKISEEIDFIILSPQVLSSLVAQIHHSVEREISVNIEDIMPLGFAKYLLRVINSNRFMNEQFCSRWPTGNIGDRILNGKRMRFHNCS